MPVSLCNKIVKNPGWIAPARTEKFTSRPTAMFFQKAISSFRLGLGALVAFGVASSAQATVIFDETFDYPDGAITENSSGTWTTVSAGTTGTLDASGGKAVVTSSRSEDIARPLGGNFTEGALYYSALITMTGIPGTSQFGAYLMHFSDTDTGTSTDFFARLFVKAVDSNTFHFGIRNRSLQASPSDYDPVYDPTAISLNTEVTIVVKFDFTTLQSTLWINPVDESSASVTDTAVVSFAGPDQTLSLFSLRQASGIGTSLIDEIKVGTAFEDVFPVAIPEPGSAGLALAGLFAAAMIARAGKRGRNQWASDPQPKI